MYDWLKEGIADASNEVLYEWMANAIATTACIGHGKGAENEYRAKCYREALIERGEDVPEIDFWKCLDDPDSYRKNLYRTGTYNGPGSY